MFHVLPSGAHVEVRFFYEPLRCCFFLVFFFLTVVRASHAGARLEQLQDGDDETEIHI